LKRPQSKPVSRNSSELPSAPASKSSTKSFAKAKKSTSKKPLFKPAPRDKAKAASNPSSNRAFKGERKRLLSIRKSEKRKGLFSKSSTEIKRFTAASRRRKIALGITAGSLGALLLLVLATIFTPLLAVEKIEIGGISRLKEKSIVNALTSQMGKPLPTISSADIATALKSFPLIESFSIISLPPHTLKIQIAERQPIGVINLGGTNYLYDPAGVRIGIATGSENLPAISINGAPEKSTQFKAAIEVLMALPADLLQRVAEINAKSKDDVTLRIRGYAGQKIIWGDGSDSVLKSRVLDALIANQKKTDRVTFDVSSPNAPVVRYGNF
jgi:cell division protein FtsQ